MTDDRDRDESLKTTATKVYLSEEARSMLDELGRIFYPGRPRVQSQTVEKLIREAYDRQDARKHPR